MERSSFALRIPPTIPRNSRTRRNQPCRQSTDAIERTTDASIPDVSRRLHRGASKRRTHHYGGCDLDRRVRRTRLARAGRRAGYDLQLRGLPAAVRRAVARQHDELRGAAVLPERRQPSDHRPRRHPQRRLSGNAGDLQVDQQRDIRCAESRIVGHEPQAHGRQEHQGPRQRLAVQPDHLRRPR